METIRLLLADDHTLVRAGIKSLVLELGHIEVIGEASDGHKVLELSKALSPDIVLLDIGMKGMNGLEVAARLHREQPHVRVLILSMHSTEEYVLRALQAGVKGYLLKESAPNELELALNAVMRGDTYLSPGVSRKVIKDYLNRISEDNADTRDSSTALNLLTSRQREILQLIAEGCTTKDIANRLSLSAKTVETHRTELMNRLDIHDIAGLVRYAIRIGLVSPDS